jgi:hypothetical protein
MICSASVDFFTEADGALYAAALFLLGSGAGVYDLLADEAE